MNVPLAVEYLESIPDAPPAPEPAPTGQITLTDEQQRALDGVGSWFRDEPQKQQLTLGGYAGTGKTTILRHLLTAGLGRVRAIAPTGKAARVLQRKGVPATTIHSFLYEFLGKDDKGKLLFGPKDTDRPNLLACDESSMVPRPIYQDLMAEGIRVLWVGDHGQLEPVGDDPKLMAAPELRLEKIHRQAAESPILQFAHAARVGELPRAQDLAALQVGPLHGIHRGLGDPKWLLGFDQILVAFNRTRTFLNMQIRQAKGYTALVEVGEKLICRKNDRRRSLFNGMLVTVESVEAAPAIAGTVTVYIRTDDDRVLGPLHLAAAQFHRTDVIDVAPGISLFDYGYAITVHKSQGSEFDRVLVVEEPCDKWSMARWRYTAITRAARELVYLSDDVVQERRTVPAPARVRQTTMEFNW